MSGRATWPQCSGPCQQGRVPCPCPQACDARDDDEEHLNVFRGLLVAIGATAATAAIVLFLSWVPV